MGFSTALTGINTASKDLQVTSNNIANANTSGFKKSRTEFVDIYASSLSSSANTTVGSGAKVATIAQNFTQGSVDFTDNAMDMAITGQGFFSMSNTPDADRPIMYTRNGEFKVNDQGYVVGNGGEYLMGFRANGTTVEEGFSEGAFSSIQLNATVGGPIATGKIDTSVNIDAREVMPTAFQTTPASTGAAADAGGVDPLDPDTYSHVSSVTTFDSLGNAHIASTYFVSERELPSSINAAAAVMTSVAAAGATATAASVATDFATVPLVTGTAATEIATNVMADIGAGTTTTATAAATAVATATAVDAAAAALAAATPSAENVAAAATAAQDLIAVTAVQTAVDAAVVAGGLAAATVATVATAINAQTGAAIDAAGAAADLAVQEAAALPNATITNLSLAVTSRPAYSSLSAVVSNTASSAVVAAANDIADVYSAGTANKWQAHFFIDGQHVKPDGTLGTSLNAATVPTSKSGLAATDYVALTFDTKGALATVAGDPLSSVITYTNVPISGANGIDSSIAVDPMTIQFDLAGTTELSSEYAVKDLYQDGIPVGNLTGIDIDDKGVVLARFSNGGFDILGKVVLSRFANNQGLENIGGSLWKETLESGQPIAGQAGTGSFGLIEAGALEGSNVDLSAELVHLIIAQQTYQANAQSISTEKTIMQTILQA